MPVQPRLEGIMEVLRAFYVPQPRTEQRRSNACPDTADYAMQDTHGLVAFMVLQVSILVRRVQPTQSTSCDGRANKLSCRAPYTWPSRVSQRVYDNLLLTQRQLHAEFKRRRLLFHVHMLR